MVSINRFQCDSPIKVEQFIQELYDSYKNVEILGITEDGRFNVFYKIGVNK